MTLLRDEEAVQGGGVRTQKSGLDVIAAIKWDIGPESAQREKDQAKELPAVQVAAKGVIVRIKELRWSSILWPPCL